MPTVDAFITDYSSLLLNFSYFERPILLFTPDYQDYAKQQGFYVGYLQYLNAPNFQTAPAMIDFINNKLPKINLNYVRQLKQKIFQNKMVATVTASINS